MAVYAAVTSLKLTIESFLNSSKIKIPPISREILKSAYEEVTSLQEYLKQLGSCSGERVNALNAQIRNAACKLKGAIEFHACILRSHPSYELLSQTESSDDELLSLDFLEVKQEYCSFTETVKKIKEENRIEDLLAEEDENISLRTDFGGKCSKMVGFSDLFSKIRDGVMDKEWLFFKYVSLVGMTGIGKTTLAMKIFEDPEILSQFEYRAFVTIGPQYQLKEVMLAILAQIDETYQKEVEDVGKCLEKTLGERSYLIVLDDVWDTSVYNLDKYLPRHMNGSRVLLTTSMQDVANARPRYNDPLGDNERPRYRKVYEIPFLSKKESWDLLCQKVFGEEYPSQLEEYGKKIAEHCEGLPLAIVAVAGILSKNDKTEEYWKETAEERNSVFTDAYDQMFEVLFPSYKYLSQHLKPCFLYMGAFPLGWEITASKVVKCFTAEHFLEPYYLTTLEYSRMCFQTLLSRSLVLVRKESSNFEKKTLSLHPAYWHMCNKQAGIEKFFHLARWLPDIIQHNLNKTL